MASADRRSVNQVPSSSLSASGQTVPNWKT